MAAARKSTKTGETLKLLRAHEKRETRAQERAESPAEERLERRLGLSKRVGDEKIGTLIKAGGGTIHKAKNGEVKKLAVRVGDGKSMKVGGGGRFARLKKSIAAKGKVSDPGAVAAAIGRKKYGKEKFQAMAAKGKRA